jgi:2-polyprenyl-3-methyl-5-hydroxy-6-metoxy-1,4-benzoquinol methylase
VGLSADRARRCIGESCWSSLDGLDVLECGCGAGRFTEVLLAQGATVTSIDMTEAVEANQTNFPQNDNTASRRRTFSNFPSSAGASMLSSAWA